MSSTVKAELKAVEELRSALGRFRKEAQETLTAVQHEVSRTQTWLRERHDYWQREREQARRAVDQARREVRRAAGALSACLAWRDSEGRGRSCSAEAAALRAAEDELRRAEARLRTAEAELQNVKQWMARVEEAVGQYAVRARGLTDLVKSGLPHAESFVGFKIADLRRYLRMEEGVLDLSRATEFGKFAHQAAQKAVENAFPGKARSEVWVTKPDGSRGRIDTSLGTMILDYKFSDLDSKGGAALRAELRNVVSQLEGYRRSRDTPESPALAVYFGFRPSSTGLMQSVEGYLGKHNISVIWGE